MKSEKQEDAVSTGQSIGEGDSPRMLPSPSFKPRPKAEIMDSEESVGEQLFLYDGNAKVVHQLNGGAAIVWLMCDGDSSINTMAKEISETYHLPLQQVITQVQEAVAEFQSLGLLYSEDG